MKRMLTTAILLAALMFTIKSDAEVSTSAETIAPLDVGASVPNPTLTKMDGTSATLSELTEGQASVVVFFRGGWCPYCTKHLAALKDVLSTITDHGYRMIAISPDSVEGNLNAVNEHEIPYTVVSDGQFDAIRDFGLAFQLDEATITLYDSYGIKMVPMDDGSYILPVPAVYLIDADGIIRYRHFDPDYKERLDPQALIEAMDSLSE